ncbi:MAG: mannose-1-phosphate guanylyltransferase/mannose-6-phosphate isomerase [Gammaproteobacteria bacterium]|nr:mannose-1-phosphate guanylyltransferase/mannose-6-phosphate isomerase [Gammaproteobacteria bacterium]
MDTITPVVLAGGTGSRLWPLSRSSSPKQLLNIVGDHTLLQETLLRCNKISALPPIIIYNKEYHFQVTEQTKHIGINSAKFIIEPVARNTAPAIAFCALEARKKDENALLFVMPADHYLSFENENDFIEKVRTAESLANDNYLVTFGIVPKAPETGYGYIRLREGLLDQKAFKVAEFIEKPEKKLAELYYKEKNCLWNSGMFLFSASAYLAELQEHSPEIFAICSKSYEKQNEKSGVIYIHPSFSACPSLSIDYAVMEKTQSAVVIPVDAIWSDIGSWSSIYDLKTKNEDGNVIEGDVITEGTKGCYIKSSHRLVAAVGVEDCIIVETRDSILIARKDQSQEIKKIVERLTINNRVEASSHYNVYRPWGAYELLIDLPNYKVKRLIVKEGCSLSLQRHKYRSEHWVVVSGTATIINGDEHLVLYSSQSTYIPQGAKHRLSNFSNTLLEIIEVQIGEYLGEDDIERFDDLYGRNEEIMKDILE